MPRDTPHETTAERSDGTADGAGPGRVTDPEALRETGVPFHEDRQAVDDAALDALREMDDLAPTGVRNDAGETLVLRIDDDCAPKVPCAAVGPGETYGGAAVEWIERQAGLTVAVDGVRAVHRLEARVDDGDRTAERYFVVLAATPVAGSIDDRPADGAVAAEWVAGLPEDAERAPGSDLFFD